MWKNTVTAYGMPAKFLHWILALCIITMLIVGLYMTGMDFSPAKFRVYSWHKSLGLVVLGLTILRLFWRWLNIQPHLLTRKYREAALAKITHVLLYICVFIMPLSGWLMSSADTIPDPLIFGFDLPVLISPDKALKTLFGDIHEITAYSLIGLITLHVAGAFKHHFVEKDRTLLRMLPFTKTKEEL